MKTLRNLILLLCTCLTMVAYGQTQYMETINNEKIYGQIDYDKKSKETYIFKFRASVFDEYVKINHDSISVICFSEEKNIYFYSLKEYGRTDAFYSLKYQGEYSLYKNDPLNTFLLLHNNKIVDIPNDKKETLEFWKGYFDPSVKMLNEKSVGSSTNKNKILTNSLNDNLQVIPRKKHGLQVSYLRFNGELESFESEIDSFFIISIRNQSESTSLHYFKSWPFKSSLVNNISLSSGIRYDMNSGKSEERLFSFALSSIVYYYDLGISFSRYLKPGKIINPYFSLDLFSSILLHEDSKLAEVNNINDNLFSVNVIDKSFYTHSIRIGGTLGIDVVTANMHVRVGFKAVISYLFNNLTNVYNGIELSCKF